MTYELNMQLLQSACNHLVLVVVVVVIVVVVVVVVVVAAIKTKLKP